MAFEQFDVVVVPFPFTDSPSTKRRPAVVLSRPGTVAPGRAVLAMITSSTAETWPQDVNVQNRETAGLTVPCRIRLKVFTLDEEQVLRRLGRLSGSDVSALQNALKTVFGLSP